MHGESSFPHEPGRPAPTATSDSQPVNTSPPSSDDMPFPTRYWWLKRLTVAGGALLVALVLLRVWWGWEANRQLQAEIASYRAAGQPVFAEEFDAVLDAVPDEDNAALLYEKAMKEMVGVTPAGISITDLDDRKPFRANLAEARALIDLNADVLLLVRRASERDKAAWTRRLADYFKSPGPNIAIAQRLLIRLLHLKGRVELFDREFDQALQTAEEMVNFGEAVGTFPVLISELIRWAMDSMTCQFVHDIAMDMMSSIASDGHANFDHARAQSLHLIDRLLDSSDLMEQLDSSDLMEQAEYALMGDRATSLYFLKHGPVLPSRGISAESFADRAVSSLAWPVFALDTLREMRDTSSVIRSLPNPRVAVDEPNSNLGIIPARNLLERITHPRTLSWSTRGSSFKLVYWQTLAQKYMAATCLALALYASDHGRVPDTLESLVPEYLPFVPVDPLSPSGESLKYCPHERVPNLYSVGRNGVDDGGKYRPDGDDIVFKLGPEPDVSADESEPADASNAESSDEAGDDDQNVDNGEGKYQ